MKKNAVILAVIILLALAGSLSAGSLSGNVKDRSKSSPAVVYLEPVPAKTFAAPKQTATMDQKGMVFVPHVLAIQLGQTVVFKNSDAAAHNVNWPSIGGKKKSGHNLGMINSGGSARWAFDKYSGDAHILCSVHPDMSAYIIVSPSPYYAEADSILGDYFIANVPDGQYKVTAWREGKKDEVKDVTVKGDTKLDF